ncbi:peptide chain release factor N(5)-glutamine methyltransferase [Frateuria edaphi]|uniref:peptide chain release factor N(5)-glutamine methyltransferase n=1 Tax=Frateuria edaphi TaxID=2898793 RepID=UPI001E61F18E|nr:peptide chain release factor N(5)-glutamine methyltransferase [Frateuria edaphi]UGB46163.1 peptide chain release factor N(5)-glutamine methyltransferase [Frateuria edaphi]
MPEVRQLLAEATTRLGDRAEAAILLAHALGKPRSWLLAHADDPADRAGAAAFAALVERRAAGEPVAYLTGHRGFWTLDLEVTPATLIPRPETELLVELALAKLPREGAPRVADLGTGSGAIALAIARECPHTRVLATDASAAALAVARRNAEANRIRNVGFAQGDWFAALGDERFDLIVSNPPYIAADDPHLERGDLRFEPGSALASGSDGLDDIRRIVAGARSHLAGDGWLLFEHGWDQGTAVRGLLDAAGYRDVFTAQDLEQRDRVSGGSLDGS